MSDQAIDATLRELTRDAEEGATRHIAVDPGVLARIPAYLKETGREGGVTIVCDANTRAAAGDRVLAHLQAAGRDASMLVLEPHAGENEVGCDDPTIDAVQASLSAADTTAVAVGAGTINDVVKMATFNLGRPYLCAATAASMNGYTSAIAAVLSGGVKRTLPAQQAEAVFADLEVMQAAPAYLNQAGFGDLLSKPYSNADWLLSHLVRDVPFARRPAELLDDAYRALLERAPDVKTGGTAGISTLTRTILLSGFTMAIAGTSAPASGGEHLVSHYWDMEQHCQGKPLRGLHGTQVGVATRISALLFERLLGLTADDIDPEAAVARVESSPPFARMAARHPLLTSAVVEEVEEQFRAKQKVGQQLRQELERVKARWPEIHAALSKVLIPAHRMSTALAEAGAADRPSALGVERDHAVRTVTVCREIRSRYVGLDLMADLGVLPGWAADAITNVES